MHQNLAKAFKKHEKGEIDQSLGCAAPKHWLKYATKSIHAQMNIAQSNFSCFSLSLNRLELENPILRNSESKFQLQLKMFLFDVKIEEFWMQEEKGWSIGHLSGFHFYLNCRGHAQHIMTLSVTPPPTLSPIVSGQPGSMVSQVPLTLQTQVQIQAIPFFGMGCLSFVRTDL